MDLILQPNEIREFPDNSPQITLFLNNLTLGDNSRLEIKKEVKSFKIIALSATLGDNCRIFANRTLIKRGDREHMVNRYYGKNGQNGRTGISGTTIQLRINLLEIVGNGLVIESNGGHGSNGGNGRKGRNASLDTSAGNGGNGGHGGHGGDGGHGGHILLQYHWLSGDSYRVPTVRMKSQSGYPGWRGTGGRGGQGGNGKLIYGRGDKGGDGNKGAKGREGQKGKMKIRNFISEITS